MTLFDRVRVGVKYEGKWVETKRDANAISYFQEVPRKECSLSSSVGGKLRQKIKGGISAPWRYGT